MSTSAVESFMEHEALAAQQDTQFHLDIFVEALGVDEPHRAVGHLDTLLHAAARRELAQAFRNPATGLRTVHRWLSEASAQRSPAQTLYRDARTAVATQFLSRAAEMLPEDQLRAAVGGLRHLSPARED